MVGMVAVALLFAYYFGVVNGYCAAKERHREETAALIKRLTEQPTEEEMQRFERVMAATDAMGDDRRGTDTLH